jgi:hypothetical protein
LSALGEAPRFSAVTYIFPPQVGNLWKIPVLTRMKHVSNGFGMRHAQATPMMNFHAILEQKRRMIEWKKS